MSSFNVGGYVDRTTFDAVVNYMKIEFPLSAICKWLVLNRPDLPRLGTREFSVQAYIPNRDHVYTKRYISGKSVNELHNQLNRHCLFRLDIGALYNVPPIEHKLYPDEYAPCYKELVFDIDMDLYNGVRQCCTGKQSCPQCWCLAKTAVRAIDYLLANVFNYKDVLWVYSGNKGFHCWVSDDAARFMTETQRRGLCEYLWLGAGEMPDVDQNTVFGELVSDVLAPFFFGDYSEKHAICAANAVIGGLATVMPDEHANAPIDANGDMAIQSAAETIGLARDWYASQCRPIEKSATVLAIMRTVWPRIDTSVTHSLKHTLKAPFCVHPDTQRVCIPVDPARIDEFDPATVPRWTEHGCTDPHTLKNALDYFKKYTNKL